VHSTSIFPYLLLGVALLTALGFEFVNGFHDTANAVAIRAEEDFATPDHSMAEWEAWDQAGFKEEDAREKAKAARKAYADALREKLYNF
jgi:hypothetical protein